MNIQRIIAHTIVPATRWIACLGLLSALGLPGAALAHSNEYLATIKGDHGGMLRMADMYHFELIVRDGEVRVWVTDHGDTAQPTRTAAGSVRLISGTSSITVKLKPDGANELVGKDTRIRATAGAKVILTVTMKDQQPLQVRYALSDLKAGEAGKH